MESLILTVSAPDRPGLVNLMADAVAAAGGNWLESRLVRLGGRFAGVALVAVPKAAVPGLGLALVALGKSGLRIVMEPVEKDAVAKDAAKAGGARLTLALVGHDRPGIVRELTDLLARRAVNIEALQTSTESASFTGDALFRATALLTLPEGETEAALQAALEALGNDLMVDIALAEG